MQHRIMRELKFSRWHEKQLFSSFAWLVSCLMCGFLFAAIVEYVAKYSSGIFTIVSLVALYVVGIAAIELFRRFWVQFMFAQRCASAATCAHCGAYGLFEVRVGTWPIYARCRKCDHQWVIGQQDN